MNDEKLIFDFLNKNYDVVTNVFGVWCVDFLDNSFIWERNLSQKITLIFGEFSQEYFFKWYTEKENKLIKKLSKYLESKPIERLSYKLFRNKFGEEFGSTYLSNKFSEYYLDNFIKDRVESLLHNEDFKYSDDKIYLNFIESFKDVPTQYNNIKECRGIITYIETTIKNWYLDKFINSKLSEIFNQFVITAASDGWRVTWIGHGKMTSKRLVEIFGLNDGIVNDYIVKQYDDWFSEEVIETSAKLWGRNKKSGIIW